MTATPVKATHGQQFNWDVYELVLNWAVDESLISHGDQYLGKIYLPP